MKSLFYLLLFIFLISCSKIDFVYEDNKNLTNPLYEKTITNTSGLNLTYLDSYLPMFFGKNNKGDFNLLINVEEKKIKRSVKTNQVTSNLRYELRFTYTLTSNMKSCVTYKKELLSYFSIIPKSDGYNYGTDASLEKKYELAITDNLNQFISLLSGFDVNNCL